MNILENELQSTNFIILPAETLFSVAAPIYTDIKANPFILLEKTNTFVGIITPHEMNLLIAKHKQFAHVLVQDLVRTKSILLTAPIDREQILLKLIEQSANYAVLTNSELKYHSVVSIEDILKAELHLFNNVDNSLSNDFVIKSQFLRAANIFQFESSQDAIICYEPVEPISILEPINNIIDNIYKCKVANCNSYYEKVLGINRLELINQQTVRERLPPNIINSNLVNNIIKSNYHATNAESLEADSNGNYKWFSNHSFFEIHSNHIYRIWVKKRDITMQKDLEIALYIDDELIKMEQRTAHTGNWQYNYQDKTVLISDEFAKIFEINAPPSGLQEAKSHYDFFLQYVLEKDRAKVKAAHEGTARKFQNFTIEYSIKSGNNNIKNLYEHCKIIKDTNGKAICAIGTILDLTSIKQQEEISWKYQEQSIELFNGSSDILFLIDVTVDGQFHFNRINPAAESILETSTEDIIKKPIADTLPEKTYVRLMAALKKCFSENKVIHDEVELPLENQSLFFEITLVPIRCMKNRIVQIIGFAYDVTPQIRNAENLQLLNKVLLCLSNSNAAIITATSEMQLISESCKTITKNSELFPLCCVFSYTDEPKATQYLCAIAYNGVLIPHESDFAINNLPGKDCLEKCRDSRAPEQLLLNMGSIKKDNPDFFSILKLNNDINLKSVLGLPLLYHGKVNYIYVIYSTYQSYFNATEVALFKELSNNLILGIINKRTQEINQHNVLIKEKQSIDLKKALDNTICALGTMLEFRDPFTAGHQKRVTHLAVAIAQEYGLELDRLHWLNIAGSVHDIGKITIPSEILSKPTKLTPLEYELVKTHPEVGYQILRNIQFPGPIAEIVRQHHEYLDGTGYPFGLKENEILLESKILTVADIIESMVSHRPYRPAFEVKYALEEITKMRGKKLDPKAVDICISIIESGNYEFPKIGHFNDNNALKMNDTSRSDRS